MRRNVRLVSRGPRTRSGSFREHALTQTVKLVVQMLHAFTDKLLSVLGYDVEAKPISSDDGGGRQSTAPKPLLNLDGRLVAM